MSMSFQSHQEYLNVIRQRYRQTSSRKEKSRLIDEAIDTLGYHRKYLIRILNQPPSPKTKKRRVKPLKYQRILPVIELVWEALDYPCTERLHPVLFASAAQQLARFGELSLSNDMLTQLQEISHPTLGRYLQRFESPKAKRRIPRIKPLYNVTIRREYSKTPSLQAMISTSRLRDKTFKKFLQDTLVKYIYRSL